MEAELSAGIEMWWRGEGRDGGEAMGEMVRGVAKGRDSERDAGMASRQMVARRWERWWPPRLLN